MLKEIMKNKEKYSPLSHNQRVAGSIPAGTTLKVKWLQEIKSCNHFFVCNELQIKVHY